jgi:hypothetical protein
MTSGRTAALVVSAEGQIAIVHTSELGAVAPHADASELPLLVDEGAVLANDGRARAALGTTPSGRVLVARGALLDALGAALVRAGCTRAVVLDRGLGDSPVHRTGTGDPPRATYDETTLSAIAVPLKPRGFRFEAETALARNAR